MRNVKLTALALAVVGLGCGERINPDPEATALVRARAGTDLAAFERGRALFERPFTKDEGLGPDYNESSCASCHSIPALGGAGDAEHMVAPDRTRYVMWQKQLFPADTLLQSSPTLFGLGYLDEYSDEEIKQGCGRDQALGIQGIPVTTEGGSRTCRFGRKLLVIDVAGFVAGAFFHELGMSNDTTPTEMSFQPGQPLDIPAPQVMDVIAFVKGLEAPPIVGDTPEGKRLFRELGCAVCHRPDWHGTDLCAHDLGSRFAGFGKVRGGGEGHWRTMHLMGVRFRPSFLHDGRTSDLDTAIRLHGGEATRVIERYTALSEHDRDMLLTYVNGQ